MKVLVKMGDRIKRMEPRMAKVLVGLGRAQYYTEPKEEPKKVYKTKVLKADTDEPKKAKKTKKNTYETKVLTPEE